jgi:hypothetical protein
MNLFKLFSLLLISTLSLEAKGFHIKEHDWITERALEGLRKCQLLPAEWDLGWSQAIRKGNKHEDTNLIRKWTKYSHFYNPNRPLRIGRADSLLSVSESQQSIRGHAHDHDHDHDLEQGGEEGDGTQDAFLLLGRIVHHLQDATVPSHVVPVNHFADDGFEKFKLKNYYNAPFSIGQCASLRAIEPAALLKETAQATLARLDQLVGYKTYKRVKRAPWSELFWEASKSNGFGQYGSLGNSFGLAQFELPDGRTVVIDPTQYHAFKSAQVDLAVRATQEAILWANQNILTER